MSKQKNFASKLALIPLAVSLSMTAGCWLDDDDKKGGGTSTTATSGVAVDGYLRGATVCVDENRNKACDDGELSTTTGAGGAWTLNMTAAQQAFAVVMEAHAGTTIDEDTGEAVDNDFAYSAPAGSTVVSAISTLIQNGIEELLATDADSREKSVAELVAEINADLTTELGFTGETIDFTKTDFVAKKADTSLTDAQRVQFAKLHVMSQIITQQIAAVLPAAVAASNNQPTAAFNALVSKIDFDLILAQVNTLAQSVDLLTDSGAGIVTTVTNATLPATPTLAEINEQAIIDDAANEVLDGKTPVDPDPTGSTGGTGGAGG